MSDEKTEALRKWQGDREVSKDTPPDPWAIQGDEWEPNQSKMPRFSIRYEGGKPVLSKADLEKPFNPDDFTAKGVR